MAAHGDRYRDESADAQALALGTVHAAVGRDYRPIAAVFRAVIDRPLRLQASALRG